MIDIHSHILPGIDDGAQTLEDALLMAEAAVKEGITHLYATPHHRNGRFENERVSIIQHTNSFNEELRQRKIPLQIIPGQEIRLYKELVDDLERDVLIPLHHQSKYLLIEFPSSNVPTYAAEILYELSLRNYTPIIVHPERNSEIMENPDLLYDLIIEGALTQITANSINGSFGKKIMNFSHDLVKANMAHFIASDAHNVSSRGFHLNRAFETIQKQYGVDARYYLQENAELVMKGESVLIEQPSHIKRKKFLGIF
ncbi:tyrosine protein phosphatase [Fictibacillus nanhaiensis]|uniref:tyrosine-protein phosphatase n=1 Tax=Fictibacillus nanhaiensis TaxID=742169 RepID=UPI002E1F417F|nr:CpsB/CapC family capsule biosynthesis tyrosine phosphatase [Fictibacillus nanhaiensis]MED1863942.1 tyrosine protein phosphatase [Fictibacillus nanhaiensis]